MNALFAPTFLPAVGGGNAPRYPEDGVAAALPEQYARPPVVGHVSTEMWRDDLGTIRLNLLTERGRWHAFQLHQAEIRSLFDQLTDFLMLGPFQTEDVVPCDDTAGGD